MPRLTLMQQRSALTMGDRAWTSTIGLGPHLRCGTIALALCFGVCGTAQAEPQDQPLTSAERGAEVRLSSETVTLPIVMVREFPFIEGSIAGVAGKLMLDTGAQDSLVVNNNRVPTEGAQPIGTGSFGSGQTFEKTLVPELRDVRIASLIYPQATNVQASDARQLERITPDFIGWFGYNAFADHTLELDYRNLQATFHGADSLDYLEGERVLLELSFETRSLPNVPIMTGQVGDLSVVAALDTGANGMLFTTQAVKDRLLEDGRLVPSQAEPDTFDLYGLQLNGHAMPVLPAIDVMIAPFPPASLMGVTEPDTLLVGYSLLHQYKTIWDFPQRRIYLLER